MRKILLIIFILFGCNTKKSDEINIVVSEVALSYKSFNKMTDKPVHVNPELAARCVGVFQSNIEEAKKSKGPHAYTLVDMYMNDLASKAFKNKSNNYPVGSIIVKDKLALHYNTDGEQRKTNDGVGGMIKRAAGYDSEHGDWEYFYFTNPKLIEAGKIKSCVSCHSRTLETDYVFGGWAKRLK